MVDNLVAGQPVVVPTGSPAGEPTPQGQGYISSSYYGNESAKIQENQLQEGQDAQALQELANKLGVDVGTLLAQQGQVQPTEEPTEDVPKEDFVAKFNTEEGQRFRQQFKDYVGVDVLEAYETVQNAAKLTAELENWRRGLVVQQEQQVLRQELGQEFDTIMPEVIEYFNGLPNEKKAALDNLDGARMIAALVRQRKAAQLRGAGANAPQYVNGNVRPMSNRTGSPYIRMSEMINWSGQELDSRMGEVARAKANGTFIYDL